jgi:hypothetical protein
MGHTLSPNGYRVKTALFAACSMSIEQCRAKLKARRCIATTTTNAAPLTLDAAADTQHVSD